MKDCTPETPTNVDTGGGGGGGGIRNNATKYHLKVKAVIQRRKNNGNPWDACWGRCAKPDSYGYIKVGNQKVWLNTRKGQRWPSWSPSKTVMVSGNETVKVWLQDRDLKDHDFIGRGEGQLRKRMMINIGQAKITIQFIPVSDNY